MEISELVWKLFLLLLPGIITTLFVRYITTNKNYPPFYFVIYSAILGMGTFLFMEFFISIYNIIVAIFSSKVDLEWGLNLSFWNSIFNNGDGLKKNEIVAAYLVAIPFGLFIGYIIQRKKLNLFLQRIKLTTRFNDGDVWSHFLNIVDVEWVIIRDNKKNLAYFGNVRSYSEANDKREILLEDVDVFTSDSWEELYSSEAVYLEFAEGSFSIENPKINH